MTPRSRRIAFAAICAAAVLLTVGFALEVRRRSTATGGETVEPVSDIGAVIEARGRPHILFRVTDIGPSHGRIAIAPLADPSGRRIITPLRCERLDFVGDSGVCLSADRGVFTSYHALIFDDRFDVRHAVPLAGVPSRVRVAPDGRLASVTVFVTGHSYAGGNFSTQTTLIDMATGRVLADLEQFEVHRDRVPFKAIDFNFWGVTFAADSNRFYATLGTGGRLFLIQGDARLRRANVVRDGVECPSLSPDGRRLVFKKRTTEGGRLLWRLTLLDLETGAERMLRAETRNVDDQVEWADATRILYSVPDDPVVSARISVWMLDVDRDVATRAIPDAVSPVVPELRSSSP